MATKRIVESKNLWFNGLSVLALVIADLMANDAVREALGGKIFLLMIAGSVVNMVIRFYTVKPIKISKPKKQLTPLEDALKKDHDAIYEG